MSNKDFNNGLVLGLSLKGLPYGIHADYKPDVSNNDTFSIIIDFKIPIDELPENFNQRSLWFYGQQEILDELDHMELTPLSWERINDHTIKFHFNDFKDLIPPMTILGTNYDGIDMGSIKMPFFKVEYEPYGVPRRVKITEEIAGIDFAYVFDCQLTDDLDANVLIPINSNPDEIININMGPITFNYGSSIDDDLFNIVLE